jgi:hypothetical protein
MSADLVAQPARGASRPNSTYPAGTGLRASTAAFTRSSGANALSGSTGTSREPRHHQLDRAWVTNPAAASREPTSASAVRAKTLASPGLADAPARRPSP